jgi:hypothetical protein
MEKLGVLTIANTTDYAKMPAVMQNKGWTMKETPNDGRSLARSIGARSSTLVEIVGLDNGFDLAAAGESSGMGDLSPHAPAVSADTRPKEDPPLPDSWSPAAANQWRGHQRLRYQVQRVEKEDSKQ